MPNHKAVAEKICALEEGEEAIIVSSGMAAISSAMMALLKTGDHVLFSEDLYGGTDYFLKEEFEKFSLKNGFNKGDIMVLVGKKPGQIKLGDVIVFVSHRERPRNDPIIHRVVNKFDNGAYVTLKTKGDNNEGQINGCNGENECTDETDILGEQLVGKAVLRIPFLGYIKIWFVEALNFIGLA